VHKAGQGYHLAFIDPSRLLVAYLTFTYLTLTNEGSVLPSCLSSSTDSWT
jgi:hypothetical protein